MTTARQGLAALLTRIALFLKGHALVEDAFDLNFVGRQVLTARVRLRPYS